MQNDLAGEKEHSGSPKQTGLNGRQKFQNPKVIKAKSSTNHTNHLNHALNLSRSPPVPRRREASLHACGAPRGLRADLVERAYDIGHEVRDLLGDRVE